MSSAFKVSSLMRFLSSVQVLIMMEKMHSTGAFVPGRHMANWHRVNMFLNGTWLFLKCVAISAQCSSAGVEAVLHCPIFPDV